MQSTRTAKPLPPRYAQHPWRVPFGQSAIDVALGWTLVLIALLLPLEGLLEQLGFQGSRTPPFYLSVVAAGMAALRLPYLQANILRNRGLLLITLTFGWSHLLFIFNPQIDMRITLIPQMIILAAMFMLFANDEQWRKRFLWAYFVGWSILVFDSIRAYATGQVLIVDIQGAERVKDIVGWTAAQHSAQVGVGLVVGLGLIYTNVDWGRRGAIIAFMIAGSFALLITNTKAATVALFITLALWLMAQARTRATDPQRFLIRGFGALAVLVLAYSALINSEIGRRLTEEHAKRFNALVSEGDYSRRDDLTEAGLKLALQNPLGIGQNNSVSAMSQLMGRAIDVHNYYLRILIDAGFVGGILFLWGLKYSLEQGWGWYRFNPAYDAFFPLVFLLIIAASAQGFHYKVTWFFLALNACTPEIEPEGSTNQNNGH